ncbi:hypothetical protein [Paenibacillus cineris]|uniref:hypothetical protein n=1 Tax=Paenibacillus cineris TaxID=237530 RepID=UPI001B1F2BE1|nr:hypothetical protein [Paenibacillus cineris]GIO63391.1 hypothetical protein J43TS9_49650 [Paenibacillus cineris]
MATGYVVTNDSLVTVILPKLIEINGTSMKGKFGSVQGINLEIASIIAVEDELDLRIGDVFPSDYTNVAHKYIKQDPQVQVEKNMAALLYESATDKQKIASLEGMLGNLLFDIAIIKGGQ